jgi:hypothetical protein
MNISKTTLTGFLSASTAALTLLAGLPNQVTDIEAVLPPEWKPWIVKIGIVATFILRVIKNYNTADAVPVATPPTVPVDAQPPVAASPIIKP